MPNEKPVPQQIPIEKIHDLPGIPKITLADKSYGGLVASILLDGVKEPVILRRREDGEYQLVSGYRRRKATELAKLKTLPALVYDMTEKEAQDYHKIANADPKAPVPGKLVEKDAKAPAEKKAEAPKAEKPAAVPAEKKPAEPVKADEKKAEAPKVEKTASPTAESKEKKASPAKTPAAKPKAAEEKPIGKTAVGPTGTSITKLLGEKLDPPSEKDKKALPVPGEGEAFSAVLHPAYLKKASINTFSVDRDSDDFKELYKSIERFGVKDPVLARFNSDGELEILSGQRRHLIATELNYPVPTIIQQLDDDDAKILVADGNLHREHISTYDLSRALRMKADSMKRKAGRKLRGVKGGPETDELIAKEMGMSTMKLNRLMKLSEATQQICDLVDDGTIAVSIAYNLAFLQPKHQDTVADLIGINVKVNNENTTNLKKIAARESLTEQKIRDVLEGKYPPKVVEKPKAAEPPAQPAPAMAPAPASIPKSPDMGTPVPGQPADKVIPFPSAPGQEAAPQSSANEPPKENAPAAQPAIPTPAAQPTAAPPVAPAEAPAAQPAEASKEAQDRENSYETKIVLRGDRLRKYFPDVSMTPFAIENSIYDALEERRQRLEKQKQKAEIFGKDKKGPVK